MLVIRQSGDSMAQLYLEWVVLATKITFLGSCEMEPGDPHVPGCSTLSFVHSLSLLSSQIAYYQYIVAVSFVSSRGGSCGHIQFQRSIFIALITSPVLAAIVRK